MKLKIFLNALVFTLLMAAIYALSYLIPSWTGFQKLNYTATLFIIRILLSCGWLLGITYHVLWDKSKAKLFRTRILFFFILVISIFVVWTVHTTYGLTDAYNKTKRSSRGWRGTAHLPDHELGLKPVPNALAFETFPVGDDIPMRYDKNGFRVPLNYDETQHIDKRPRILFLGCSFTYGAACIAEETFPFLVEKELNGYTINAGVCSYGFTQMYMLAQKLIPEYKPDFVVFQNSPWLVERALSCYGPTYQSILPTPYFDSQNKVVYSLFESNSNKYPTEHFNHTEKSFVDYLSFMKASIPLSMQDDFRKFSFDVKQFFHVIPKPNKNPENAEQFVFSNVHELCEKNKCKLVVLNISMPKYKKGIFKPDVKGDVAIANADSALYANLGNNEEYKKKYNHYRMSGSDSVFVDSHPNPVAHKIIAAEIVKAIHSLGTTKP